jgi:hypothetical protein
MDFHVKEATPPNWIPVDVSDVLAAAMLAKGFGSLGLLAFSGKRKL